MKEFKCKGCKEAIALTDGKYLYAGGLAFSFKTTGVCLHCGQVNCWRPLIGLKKGKSIMISDCVDGPLSLDGLPELIGNKNV